VIRSERVFRISSSSALLIEWAGTVLDVSVSDVPQPQLMCPVACS